MLQLSSKAPTTPLTPVANPLALTGKAKRDEKKEEEEVEEKEKDSREASVNTTIGSTSLSRHSSETLTEPVPMSLTNSLRLSTRDVDPTPSTAKALGGGQHPSQMTPTMDRLDETKETTIFQDDVDNLPSLPLPSPQVIDDDSSLALPSFDRVISISTKEEKEERMSPLHKECLRSLRYLYKQYIVEHSTCEINVSSRVRKSISYLMDEKTKKKKKTMEEKGKGTNLLFLRELVKAMDDAAKECYNLIRVDTFRRFKLTLEYQNIKKHYF